MLLTIAPPEMKVREARDLYLSENGFSTDEYTKEMSWLVVLGKRFEFRNSPSRRKLLPFHDLHHVALGFGTDVAGEFEVSCFEARAGLPNTDAMVRFLVWQGTLAGFVSHPVRALAAFRGNRAKKSFISHPIDYETALEMTVGELREHLGIPREGLVSVPPKSHAQAPGRAQNSPS